MTPASVKQSQMPCPERVSCPQLLLSVKKVKYGVPMGIGKLVNTVPLKVASMLLRLYGGVPVTVKETVYVLVR